MGRLAVSSGASSVLEAAWAFGVLFAVGCSVDRALWIDHETAAATSASDTEGGVDTDGSLAEDGTAASAGEGTRGGDESTGGIASQGGHETVGPSEGSASGDDDQGTGSEPSLPSPRQVFFNAPALQGIEDATAENVIVDMIEGAVPGSSIRVAFHHFALTRVAEALLGAKVRGVDVKIVLDNSNAYPPGSSNCPGTEPCPWNAIVYMREHFAASDFIECNRELYGVAPYANGTPGCIGDVINQNKFLLFSELDDGSRDVVVQASGDLTRQARCQHNSLVVLRGDAGLYDAYSAYWDDLAAQQINLDYAWSATGTSGDSKVAFFPRARTDANDPADNYLDILSEVQCEPGATIHLAHSHWTASRAAVAQRLAELAAQGCEVQIVVGEREGNIDPRIWGLDSVVFPGDSPCGGDRVLVLHDKTMLISAPVGPAEAAVWQKLVVVGSHNLSNNALRHNDETLLQIRDDELYEEFLANWERLRGDALALSWSSPAGD